MTDETTPVYRAIRPVRYGGGERYSTGDLVIDPPAFAVEKLGEALERLDEDGRLPRETLRKLHYTKLQQIAAAGDVDVVDGNSPMNEIIDAYAIDGSDEAADTEDE